MDFLKKLPLLRIRRQRVTEHRVQLIENILCSTVVVLISRRILFLIIEAGCEIIEFTEHLLVVFKLFLPECFSQDGPLVLFLLLLLVDIQSGRFPTECFRHSFDCV